jgi:hypothetical protein
LEFNFFLNSENVENITILKTDGLAVETRSFPIFYSSKFGAWVMVYETVNPRVSARKPLGKLEN